MNKNSNIIPWNKVENIHISNLSEDVWPFIQLMNKSEEREAEVLENALLADRDLFGVLERRNTLLVSPLPIDTDFVAYVRALTAREDLWVISPNQHSGRTSFDILRDARLFSLMKRHLKNKRVVMTSHVASYDFSHLALKLRESGIKLVTPELPSASCLWTVDFFGSKTGIRQTAQALSDRLPVVMTEGYITHSPDEAAAIGASMHARFGGVVIKAPKGHAGAGVLIIKPSELSKTFEDSRSAILAKLKSEPYFQTASLVVERFVPINTRLAGGNPSLEYRIRENGSLQFLYPCAMRVTESGVFKGIEIGENIFPKRLLTELKKTGAILGSHFRRMGYRGFFDVDCIINKSERAYLTECNLRRTGGTHVLVLSRVILGVGFMSSYHVLAHNIFDMPTKKTINFSNLMKILMPLLFSQDRAEGLVITSASLLARRQFGYAIIGKTRAGTIAIERQMTELLQRS